MSSVHEDFHCADPVYAERLQALRGSTPSDEIMCDLADFYRVLGDSTRVRILYALSRGPLCVCYLADYLGMTQSAVSHQLRVLKQARLVTGKRMGKQVAYGLADDHVAEIFEQGVAHIME